MQIRPAVRPARMAIAAGAVVLLPFTTAACDIDGNAGSGGGLAAEQIVATKPYFAGEEFLGKTITLDDVTVIDVLTPRSFVIDAGAWGDDSVLMLFVRDVDEVQEGSIIQITGTVKRFTYGGYAGQYDLAEAEAYESYAEEEFLVATTIATTGHSSET